MLSEVVQPKVRAVTAKAVAQKVIKFFFIAFNVCYTCLFSIDSTDYLEKSIIYEPYFAFPYFGGTFEARLPSLMKSRVSIELYCCGAKPLSTGVVKRGKS